MIKINDLKIFNQDVIPVYTTDTGEKVVIGRELHERLGIGKKYADWFKDMCGYGFEEGESYFPFSGNRSDGKPGKGRTEHLMKFDMAKHIAMIQRSEIGMKIRQKLIDLEKTVNDIMPTGETLVAMALVEAQKILEAKDEQIRQQKQIIEVMEPKAEYCDRILKAPGLVNVRTIAKEYGMSAKAFNQMLYEYKIQYKDNRFNHWLPYWNYDHLGYMHTEPYYDSYGNIVSYSSKWTTKGWKFLYDFLKGKDILPLIERDQLLGLSS